MTISNPSYLLDVAEYLLLIEWPHGSPIFCSFLEVGLKIMTDISQCAMVLEVPCIR